MINNWQKLFLMINDLLFYFRWFNDWSLKMISDWQKLFSMINDLLFYLRWFANQWALLSMILMKIWVNFFHSVCSQINVKFKVFSLALLAIVNQVYLHIYRIHTGVSNMKVKVDWKIRFKMARCYFQWLNDCQFYFWWLSD